MVVCVCVECGGDGGGGEPQGPIRAPQSQQTQKRKTTKTQAPPHLGRRRHVGEAPLRPHDRVGLHRRLDAVHGEDDGPVADAAQSGGGQDGPRGQLGRGHAHALGGGALQDLKGAQVDRVGGRVAQQGRAEPLERPPEAVLLERRAHARADGRVGRHVVRHRLGADDLDLDLGLVKVDRALGERRDKAGHRAGLVKVRGPQRPRAAVGVGREPALAAAEGAEERRAEEHLPRERRRDALVEAAEALPLHRLARAVEHAGCIVVVVWQGWFVGGGKWVRKTPGGEAQGRDQARANRKGRRS